jgi:hypothetical protein
MSVGVCMWKTLWVWITFYDHLFGFVILSGDALHGGRNDLVKASLKETFEYMEFDICRVDEYEKFEKKFFTVFMDNLHPYYYDNFIFGEEAYDVMYDILQDLYYVDCTEFYFNGRKDC